eukprot:TRINITY_DN9147_c0_g1_i1.p1 TRINITY_DN9147_c0_g1~~TRINITY_DN9147_c0_g1_i1.p1  ORF type:complete len:197 (+),score=4.71 TRINITY_DN9147_c0_g1_i1:51-641(+)
MQPAMYATGVMPQMAVAQPGAAMVPQMQYVAVAPQVLQPQVPVPQVQVPQVPVPQVQVLPQVQLQPMPMPVPQIPVQYVIVPQQQPAPLDANASSTAVSKQDVPDSSDRTKGCSLALGPKQDLPHHDAGLPRGRPKPRVGRTGPMRTGYSPPRDTDWICRDCGNCNWGSRLWCKRCGVTRPSLTPGQQGGRRPSRE